MAGLNNTMALGLELTVAVLVRGIFETVDHAGGRRDVTACGAASGCDPMRIDAELRPVRANPPHGGLAVVHAPRPVTCRGYPASGTER